MVALADLEVGQCRLKVGLGRITASALARSTR
jgi:hypothetical protein